VVLLQRSGPPYQLPSCHCEGDFLRRHCHFTLPYRHCEEHVVLLRRSNPPLSLHYYHRNEQDFRCNMRSASSVKITIIGVKANKRAHNTPSDRIIDKLAGYLFFSISDRIDRTNFSGWWAYSPTCISPRTKLISVLSNHSFTGVEIFNCLPNRTTAPLR
jgi:hypothetical protein